MSLRGRLIEAACEAALKRMGKEEHTLKEWMMVETVMVPALDAILDELEANVEGWDAFNLADEVHVRSLVDEARNLIDGSYRRFMMGDGLLKSYDEMNAEQRLAYEMGYQAALAGIPPDPPSLTSKRRWCEVHQIRVDEGEDVCQVALVVGRYREPLACRFVRGLWVIEQVEEE